MKYINAHETKYELSLFFICDKEEGESVTLEEIEQVIDRMEPADVAEVKHGKWIKTYEYGNADLVQCSACLMEFDYIDGVCYLTDRKLPEFCPNCGADMRGEKDD